MSKMTLHSIAGYDRTQLRAESGGAAKVFAELNQLAPDDEHPDRTQVVAAARSMLAVALESPQGKDDEQLTRQLAFPVVTYLDRSGLFDEFVVEAAELRRHPATKSVRGITDLLPPPPLGESRAAETPPLDTPGHRSAADGAADDPVEATVRSLAHGEIPPLVDGVSLGNTAHLVSSWTAVRQDASPDDRHRADVWCLRLALLKGNSCPLEFAQALYGDTEFWSSPSAGEFCTGLAQPIESVQAGELQAALLNSGVSLLRPRLFLSAPDTPVLRKIADPLRREAEQLEAELRSKLQLDLMNAVAKIQRELARGLAPRKEALRELGARIDDVLGDLGCEAFGEFSDVVPFNPREHQPAKPLAPGDPVRIQAPGLRQLEAFTASEREEHLRELSLEERRELADRVVVLIKAAVAPAGTENEESIDGT